MKPGLYNDMPFSEYRAIKAVNASFLADMTVSPSHARQLKDKGYTTKTLDFGRAVHCAVLEPTKFNNEYAIYTGKTRRGKKWDAFNAANEGKEILKVEEETEAKLLAMSVHSHPLAAGLLLEDGISEATIIWNEPLSGMCASPGLTG